MSTQTQTLTDRVPWLDRWHEPTLEQLIESLKPHQQRNFGRIIETLDQYAQIRQSLIWYGASWKWTIHYLFRDGEGVGEEDTMCYIVPNVESPLISIPLSDELLRKLPFRRLSKFIRDGIRSSKCAVTYHWANWTPGLENEVGMLLDLLKRKYKHRTGQ